MSQLLIDSKTMLFNSYIHIFVFLPITLLGFHLIGRCRGHLTAIAWLVGASLFFYGWWNPVYLGLIIASILFNYTMGRQLIGRSHKLVLIVGITANLGLLVYFKYFNFFIDNFNILTSSDIVVEQVILPLAISFFTFQQITYLIDAYRGETREYNFLYYCLFVTFFPQLIAGPIVHHKEMLPQFAKNTVCRLKAEHLAIGLTIFLMGLFKKVVFADGVAVYSTPVFEAARQGVTLTFFEAWGGALAYTLQLYFDFSGYSDMAIGLGRMFGIILPVNFFSPYKAHNIIDFWKRWHITLSRFLRDYLYIPLGGNRKGESRRYINLMTTMLLGGLWHGAGWTFIIWGGIHGVYLMINHGWHKVKAKIVHHDAQSSIAGFAVSWLLTFFSVVIAWVVFRAETIDGALAIYSGMFGLNGISLPVSAPLYLGSMGDYLGTMGVTYDGMFYHSVFGDPKSGCLLIGVLLGLSWFAPNTLEWMESVNPALGVSAFGVKKNSKLRWSESVVCSVLVSIIAVSALMMISGASEFLYFRF